MSKKKPVNVDEILSQGLSIIRDEITKIQKGQVDSLLDTKVTQSLNDHIRTLLAFKREERQANMEEDLEKLDDAELTMLAKQAAQFITKPPNHPAGKVTK